MTSPTEDDIKNAAKFNLDSCLSKNLWLLKSESPRKFIAAASVVGDLDHYKYFSGVAKSIVDVIRTQHGDSACKIFLRVVLLQAILDLIDQDGLRNLPPLVSKYQRIHLFRIANDSRMDEEWLNLSHDLFHKEFGLVSMRLFSAGAQLIDVRCGIPRSILFKQGIFRALKRLISFLRLGGFKPYFQIHTHKFNLDQFNETGWEECYRCCVELYEIYPKSLGMFGSSWFYDPALAPISPRLEYLRKIPLDGGAELMFYSSGGDAIGNSTATSPSRRELYEAGKYMPKNYMLIWGRDAQIRWVKKFRVV